MTTYWRGIEGKKRRIGPISTHIYDKLAKGDAIIVTLVEKGIAEYRLRSGQLVSGFIFENLKDNKLIRPVEDGLLPGVTQTWVIDNGLR